MGSFVDSLPEIRRLLRDPDGAIWTVEQLFRYWQHTHLEMSRKAQILVDARALEYPTRFDASYMYEWEKQFLEGDMYRCFTHWQVGDEVCLYPWEAAAWMVGAGPTDDGIRWMHPWEAAMALSAEPVPFLIPRDVGQVRFIAYDERPVVPQKERELAGQDGWYQSRRGQAYTYFPIEEGERLHALYPQPPIVFDDETTVGEVFEDTGGIVNWSDGLTETGDTGITLESIGLEDHLWMVWDVTPVVSDMDDESPYPEPFIHYLHAGVLEWAFGADTDGYIPSLRDYWRMRKDAGIEAMKRFQRLMLTDRDIQMGGGKRPTRSRGPAMPDHYPEP